MDGIPEDVVKKLKNFNDAMKNVENSLEEFLSIPYLEQSERPFLEKGRLELTALFTLNSFYWTYISCCGKQPKENDELAIELKKTKEYMTKLKQYDELHLRPKVSRFASKAFVRNALFDVNADASPMQDKRKLGDGENDDWDASESLQQAKKKRKA